MTDLALADPSLTETALTQTTLSATALTETALREPGLTDMALTALTLTPLTLGLAILGVFALAAGVALLVPEMRDRLAYAGMANWPAVSGVLLRRDVVEYLDNTRTADGKPRWQLQLEYVYTVEGRDYLGQRIGPKPDLYRHRAAAEKAALVFAPGQKLIVHHHPHNPSDAVLRPVAAGTPRLVASLMLLLGGIASLVMISPLTPPPPLPPSVIPRADCAAWRGTYQHMADPRFVARFVRTGVDASAASPYFLNVFTPSQRNYWFRFEMSNGYGGIHLIPVKNPRLTADNEAPADIHDDGTGTDTHSGEEGTALLNEHREQLRFYPLDHELRILDHPPQMHSNRGGTPAFLLMPELGNLLWYEPGLLNGQPGSAREELPRGLFKLVHCELKPLL
ncbi:MAG: DUF3592 domain-containing protein [Moraxellaceae bacterium]|nr:DUF3592 domain-containing protein [Moraxellaceae bacterium]